MHWYFWYNWRTLLWSTWISNLTLFLECNWTSIQDFPKEKDDESDDLRPERPNTGVLGSMATEEEYRDSLLRLFWKTSHDHDVPLAKFIYVFSLYNISSKFYPNAPFLYLSILVLSFYFRTNKVGSELKRLKGCVFSSEIFSSSIKNGHSLKTPARALRKN